MRRTAAAAALAAVLLPVLAACGGSDKLTVYSGRNENLVGPLLARFEEETGIDVEVRYGDSAELAATIAEEGENSPADIFFAQDAGSLGAVAEERLLTPLPDAILDKVDQRFRDPGGRWVGTSGRARVIAYNTDALSEADLPATIWDFADAGWNGRIGFPPTNASFQAMVTAMRIEAGDERTRRWLEKIAANEPKLYENNVQTLEAVAAGEVDVGFVNHYYLYELLNEQPDARVANHYLEDGDPGALVNVAGVGILASSDSREDAERFVEFLLGQGQRYFADETAEYPLVDGVPAGEELPPLSELQGPQIELGALGPELEGTLDMLNEVGLTT
jgi:iron(III) transport system substrate-binding protein